MGTGVRLRAAWVLVGALTTTVGIGVLGAGSAAADTTAQECTLNLTTGDFTCTTADPAKAGRLARPAAAGAGAVLLGRFYDLADRDGAGSYFNVTAATGCDTSPDLDFTVGTMPAGWNDRVSSFQGYNSCQVKLWKDGNASGSSLGPANYDDSLGSMDNQTSSITFY